MINLNTLAILAVALNAKLVNNNHKTTGTAPNNPTQNQLARTPLATVLKLDQ